VPNASGKSVTPLTVPSTQLKKGNRRSPLQDCADFSGAELLSRPQIFPDLPPTVIAVPPMMTAPMHLIDDRR
jgi:hypothetical protein